MKEKAAPRIVLVLFGVAFFLMGAVFVRPYVKAVRAAMKADDWRQTPCRILQSQLVRGNGDSFEVSLEFEYLVDGKTHRSSRYQFMHPLSATYETKQQIVDNLAAGTETFCFVDPADPSAAVLHPKLTWDMAVGLAPLMFMGIGLLVTIKGLRPVSTAGEAVSAWETDDQATELKSPDRSLIELLAFLILAIAWNAAVVSMTTYFRKDIAEGMFIFVVPFGLAGVGLLGFFVYKMLSYFNPVTRLRLSSARLRAGETFRLQWWLNGNTSRLQSVRITLEGVRRVIMETEEGYQDKVFAEIAILDTGARLSLPQGEEESTLPTDRRSVNGKHLLALQSYWRDPVLAKREGKVSGGATALAIRSESRL